MLKKLCEREKEILRRNWQFLDVEIVPRQSSFVEGIKENSDASGANEDTLLEYLPNRVHCWQFFDVGVIMYTCHGEVFSSQEWCE